MRILFGPVDRIALLLAYFCCHPWKKAKLLGMWYLHSVKLVENTRGIPLSVSLILKTSESREDPFPFSWLINFCLKKKKQKTYVYTLFCFFKTCLLCFCFILQLFLEPLSLLHTFRCDGSPALQLNISSVLFFQTIDYLRN